MSTPDKEHYLAEKAEKRRKQLEEIFARWPEIIRNREFAMREFQRHARKFIPIVEGIKARREAEKKNRC